MKIVAIAAAASLAFGGAAFAQDHHDLGASMGTQTSATPQSTSASMASGAHNTPVAKAGRHHASRSHPTQRAGTTSRSATTAAGSGNMGATSDSNPGQHN